jgi:hypothetical protein
LVRRIKWALKKLLASQFLLPVHTIVVPDEMNSIILPEDSIDLIGVFNPEHVVQGDMIERLNDTDELYSFVKRNFSVANQLFYDFTNPINQEASFIKRGLPFFQRENRLFFDHNNLNFIDGSTITGVSVLYTRLPFDDRGDLIPDFMVECLSALVNMVVLKRDMYMSVRGQKQANMPQIRMMMSDMEKEYKFKCKQARVAQQDIIANNREVVPITYST